MTKIETSCANCVFCEYNGLDGPQQNCSIGRLAKYKNVTKIIRRADGFYHIQDRICSAKRSKIWLDNINEKGKDAKSEVRREIQLRYDLFFNLVKESPAEIDKAIWDNVSTQKIKPAAVHLVFDSTYSEFKPEDYRHLFTKYEFPVSLEYLVEKSDIYERENLIAGKSKSSIYVVVDGWFVIPPNFSSILDSYLNDELRSFAYINYNMDAFFVGRKKFFQDVGGNGEQNAYDKIVILLKNEGLNVSDYILEWSDILNYTR